MARPSKYKPEYDAMLIGHMASGLSFETFAPVVKVNLDTLYEWAKLKPTFAEAKKTAFQQNLLFWEKLGIMGATGRIKNFNVTAWIFNMKNRHGWRDVKQLEHSGPNSSAIKYENLPDEQLDKLLKEALSLLGNEKES